MADENLETPAVKWGEPGYYEDWLVGNRSGFQALRDTIDEMLANGSDTPMPDRCECDFQGLSISPAPKTSADNSGSGWVSTIGCILALVFLVGLIILGIWKMVDLILN